MATAMMGREAREACYPSGNSSSTSSYTVPPIPRPRTDAERNALTELEDHVNPAGRWHHLPPDSALVDALLTWVRALWAEGEPWPTIVLAAPGGSPDGESDYTEDESDSLRAIVEV